jgi:ribonuclease HI
MASVERSAPHYLLISQLGEGFSTGHWRFVLRNSDGSQRLEAHDVEPHVQGERLELLTVARGLEALGQPSHVTLVTSSPHVREGIQHGLAEWRSNGWCWERFGQMVPVKNADLWQRVERAMQYHEIDCRTYRFDRAHPRDAAPFGGYAIPQRCLPIRPEPPKMVKWQLTAMARRFWSGVVRGLGGVGRRCFSALPPLLRPR